MSHAASQSFQAHKGLIAASLSFALFIIGLALYIGATISDFLPYILFPPSYSKYLILVPLLFLVVFLLQAGGVFIRHILSGTLKNALSDAVKVFDTKTAGYIRSRQFWDALAALTAMVPLSLFFCIAKSLIPHLTTYSWDPQFAAWDKMLHGGTYPHEPLIRFVEAYGLQAQADLFYFLFFMLIVIVNGYCIFCDPDFARRKQYLWATLLSWVVGGFVLAASFASVGPIFYADFYDGPSPYQDFIAYLVQSAETYNLQTVPLSRVLLEWVRDESIIDINAISAMPSMHVGIAALAAIYMWNVNKAIGVLCWIFVLITLGVTIYLGLHYAVDGYAGIIMVYLFWRLSAFFNSDGQSA